MRMSHFTNQHHIVSQILRLREEKKKITSMKREWEAFTEIDYNPTFFLDKYSHLLI